MINIVLERVDGQDEQGGGGADDRPWIKPPAAIGQEGLPLGPTLHIAGKGKGGSRSQPAPASEKDSQAGGQ